MSRYGGDPYRASTGAFRDDYDERIRSGTRYASPPRQRQARRQPFQFDELGEARLGPERSGPLVRMGPRLAPPSPRYGGGRSEHVRYHEEDDERDVIRESGRFARRPDDYRETRERYHEEDEEYSTTSRRPRNRSFGAVERRPRYDAYERERERDRGPRDYREKDLYERDVYERDVHEEYRPPPPAPAPRPPPVEDRYDERYREDIEIDYEPRRRPEAYEYERIHEREVERRRTPSASSSSSSESRAPTVKESFPKKGKTRFPKKLVSRRAVVELGYPYTEEIDVLVVTKALSKVQIDEVIELSETYRGSKALRAGPQSMIQPSSPNRGRQTYDVDLGDRPVQQALEAPPPPPPQIQEEPAPPPIIIQIPAAPAAAPSVAPSRKSKASKVRSSHHSDHEEEEESVEIYEKITRETKETSRSSSSSSSDRTTTRVKRKEIIVDNEASNEIRGPLSIFRAGSPPRRAHSRARSRAHSRPRSRAHSRAHSRGPSRSRSRVRSRRDLEKEIRLLEEEHESKVSSRARSRSKSRRRKSTSLKIKPEIDLNVVKNRKGQIELVREP